MISPVRDCRMSRHRFTNHAAKYWNSFGDNPLHVLSRFDVSFRARREWVWLKPFLFEYKVWEMFNRSKTSLPDYKHEDCGGFTARKTESNKFAWKWHQKCKLYNVPRWRNQKQIGFQANKQVVNDQTWNAVLTKWMLFNSPESFPNLLALSLRTSLFLLASSKLREV